MQVFNSPQVIWLGGKLVLYKIKTVLGLQFIA